MWDHLIQLVTAALVAYAAWLGQQARKDAAATKAIAQETQAKVEAVEHATNGMKKALEDAARAEGKEEGRVEGEAKAAALATGLAVGLAELGKSNPPPEP